MFRPILRIPRAGALIQRTRFLSRSKHTAPVLDQFRDDKAVPGFLSPGGYNTAWTEYMEHVTDKLNGLTEGTEYAQQSALTILKSTARDSSQAAIFNYASMAFNNHFFFTNLANLATLQNESSTGVEASEKRIPPKLRQELERQFSSIETLRLEMQYTALAMFGPGFVWLVKNANTSEMRILATYLAGTPFTAGHWRRQGTDFNTTAGDASTTTQYFERATTGVGNSGGRFEPQAPGGTDVIPLLCLNTWEHVWLQDYGIRGKEAYVHNWWEAIDWNKVEGRAIPARRDDMRI